MNITVAEALSHIMNSLDNSDALSWTNDEGVEWSLSADGENGIEFCFTDEDDNETYQFFRLVEE